MVFKVWQQISAWPSEERVTLASDSSWGDNQGIHLEPTKASNKRELMMIDNVSPSYRAREGGSGSSSGWSGSSNARTKSSSRGNRSSSGESGCPSGRSGSSIGGRGCPSGGSESSSRLNRSSSVQHEIKFCLSRRQMMSWLRGHHHHQHLLWERRSKAQTAQVRGHTGVDSIFKMVY